MSANAQWALRSAHMTAHWAATRQLHASWQASRHAAKLRTSSGQSHEHIAHPCNAEGDSKLSCWQQQSISSTKHHQTGT